VRSLVYEVARRTGQESIDHKVFAAAKSFCGQIALQCIETALEMGGGCGYSAGYLVQELFRHANMIEIYERTTEIEKLIMARNLLP